ncbi:MAG TPA: hypothetical protein VFA10_15485 [Ktedonobacteraceae bacterium]|jgi:hypothetical protein|nr:hypothetical protein [Ktedonobacteraceae bacterium]
MALATWWATDPPPHLPKQDEILFFYGIIHYVLPVYTTLLHFRENLQNPFWERSTLQMMPHSTDNTSETPGTQDVVAQAK